MAHRTRLKLLAITLFLTPSFVRADEAERQALAAVKRLNGAYNPDTAHLILYDSAVRDDDLRIIAAGLPRVQIMNLNVTRTSDQGLAHLAKLIELRTLCLSRTHVSDAGLKHLLGLPRLQTLILHATAVGDAGLEHLGAVKSLETLYLSDTRVSDAGIRHLAGLVNLRDLNLSGTSATNAGLAHLKGLTDLRRLDLRDTRVTVAGLSSLRELKQLQYHLDLPSPKPTVEEARALAQLEDAGARIAPAPSRWRSMADFDERRPPFAGLAINLRHPMSDKDLGPLSSVPQVQIVTVGSRNITDAGLANLMTLSNLEEVDLLCLTHITDKGLEHLKGLTSLRRLILDGTNVTDAGLVNLHGLVRLQYVRLGKHVTLAGARDLKIRLPNTHVVKQATPVR
jgi:Leucine-rich repeat (LRR) protein